VTGDEMMQRRNLERDMGRRKIEVSAKYLEMEGTTGSIAKR